MSDIFSWRRDPGADLEREGDANALPSGGKGSGGGGGGAANNVAAAGEDPLEPPGGSAEFTSQGDSEQAQFLGRAPVAPSAEGDGRNEGASGENDQANPPR